MFGRKKNIPEETFTPQDLEKLREKGDSAVFGKFLARRDANELTKTQRWQRRSFWALLALVAILLVMYLLSLFITQWGDLVISVDRGAQGHGIRISENKDGKDGSVILSASAAKEVTNITYDWLPFDVLDKKDGSYNGKNYLAYTFYLENNGNEKATIEGVLSVNGVSKGMDEAVRVMVYVNGEPKVYAKPQYKTKNPEPDTEAFIDNTTIMRTLSVDVAPKTINKYTIVSWVEGNDPECINDIMGGYMRMNMLFSIADG